MFTGLIQHQGKLLDRKQIARSEKWTIEGPLAAKLQDGASISVNGVCLTALSPSTDLFEAELSPETLSRTTLGSVPLSCDLNLELPATPTSYLGGHIVQGHIDGLGKITAIENLGSFTQVQIGLPSPLMIYMVPKGSVCVDGVSLTINSVGDNHIELMIIPATWDKTLFSTYTEKQQVNIEADCFVKTLHHFWSRTQFERRGSDGIQSNSRTYS